MDGRDYADDGAMAAAGHEAIAFLAVRGLRRDIYTSPLEGVNRFGWLPRWAEYRDNVGPAGS